MTDTIIFIYTFSDGTSFRLIDFGFSIAELWALEKMHGKLTKQEVCQL